MHVRDSRRVQARDCGARARPSDFAAGLICLSLVKVLDRLAEKGLITRTRSQTDRRSNLLDVTPRGRSALNKVEPLMDRIEQRILAPLSAGDQRKFLEMLTQLVHVNNAYSRAPLDREVWSDLLRKQGTQVQSPGKARRAPRKQKRGGSE